MTHVIFLTISNFQKKYSLFTYCLVLLTNLMDIVNEK